MLVEEKIEKRGRRHRRIRKKLVGTTERPRLVVFRSQRHIYAQIIDDFAGRTLVSASSLDKELRKKIKDGSDAKEAAEVGRLLAERARVKQIQKVAFDRGGNVYHGRVKALAEAAREKGLNF